MNKSVDNATLYKNLDDGCLDDVTTALGSGLSDSFWEAFSANGVEGNVADLRPVQDKVMGYIENYDDAALGRLVRHQITKRLIQDAQPRLQAMRSVKYLAEDLETACGV